MVERDISVLYRVQESGPSPYSTNGVPPGPYRGRKMFYGGYDAHSHVFARTDRQRKCKRYGPHDRFNETRRYVYGFRSLRQLVTWFPYQWLKANREVIDIAVYVGAVEDVDDEHAAMDTRWFFRKVGIVPLTLPKNAP